MNLKPILLVEDNPQDEALTLRALKKANLANRVVVVRDGQQAVDYLFGGSELPVVVLLDLGLPRLGGLEVLERLRADARTRILPVVIFTSSDEDRDRLRGYESGANSFIQKPIDFARFAETVGRLGIYWSILNEPAPPGVPEP